MAQDEANFPKLLTSVILITLFIVLISGFIIGIGSNYGIDTTEVTDRVGLTTTTSSLTNLTSSSEGWKDKFVGIGDDGVWDFIIDILGLLTVGMFRLLTTMANFVFIPFKVIGAILVNVLGVPVIVANVINTLIILSVVFGIWSLIKRGV